MSAKPGLFLALIAVFVCGCGGGGASETTRNETVAQEQENPGAGQEGKEPGGGSESSPAASVPDPDPRIASKRVPGAKAVAPGVPVIKGGDNSIQAFGVEGETNEAGEALASLRRYLDARLGTDWPSVCASASEEYRSQLELMIERAKVKGGEKKPEGCAETLALLLGRTPTSHLRALMPRELLSFRVDEPYAYLIYEDSEGAIRFTAMAEEDGTWKVNVPEPTEFVQAEEARR